MTYEITLGSYSSNPFTYESYESPQIGAYVVKHAAKRVVIQYDAFTTVPCPFQLIYQLAALDAVDHRRAKLFRPPWRILVISGSMPTTGHCIILFQSGGRL